MARLLFVIDTLEVGGAERSLCAILGGMKAHDAAICQIYPGDALLEDYRAAGVHTIQLGVRPKYRFAEAIGKLRETIRREKPDLVITTLFRSDVIGRTAAWLERVRVVSCFVNDTYSPLRKREMPLAGRAKHRALWLLDALTARLADHFVSNSQAIARSNARSLGLDGDKISVIYRGRDSARFTPVARSARVAGRDVPVTLLNVARLEDRKGQADLVGAMPEILRSYPAARLLIAGEGRYRSTLERLMEELGLADAVTLLGSRRDIPELIAAADLFVSASIFEGLPGAVVEAMLSGIPVLLSDMDVHREMVGEEPGVLFRAGDPHAIARAAVGALDDYRAALGGAERLRRKALANFDIEHVVRAHERLYASLVNGGRKGLAQGAS